MTVCQPAEGGNASLETGTIGLTSNQRRETPHFEGFMLLPHSLSIADIKGRMHFLIHQ